MLATKLLVVLLNVNIVISFYENFVDISDQFKEDELKMFDDLHYLYCPVANRCASEKNQSTESTDSTFVSPVCCSQCFCEYDCFMYGNCCPDFLNTFKSNAENKYTCRRLQYKESNYKEQCASFTNKQFEKLQTDNVVMIKNCVKNFTDHNLRNLCETVPTTVESTETVLPVSSLATGETYVNIFCGLCNLEKRSQLLSWKIVLNCFNDTFFPKNSTDLFARLPEAKCKLSFRGIDEIPTHLCPPMYNYLVDTCNVTRLWDVRNSSIEQACHAYLNPYIDTAMYSYGGGLKGGKVVYKNVFCYLCNVNQQELSQVEGKCAIELMFPTTCVNNIPKFSAILDFTGDSSNHDINILGTEKVDLKNLREEHDESKCSTGFIWDEYSMECREILCYGFRAYSNGTCKPTMTDIKGLCFDVVMKLLTSRQFSTQFIYHSSTDSVAHIVGGKQAISNMEFIFDKQSLATELNTFENESSLFSKTENTGQRKKNIETQAKHFMAKTQFCYMENVPPNFVENILLLDNSMHEEDSFMKTHIKLQSSFRHDFENPLKITHDFSNNINCICEVNNLRIGKFTICPQIELKADDKIKWHINASGLYIEDFNISSIGTEYIKDDQTGAVRVCLEAFIPVFKTPAGHWNDHRPKRSSVQKVMDISPVAYVSLACTSLSVSCLLFTLGTYIRFPVLRTQPGINNMCLCVAMLCAQILYQFGTGQKENVPHWACVCIGSLVHFLWLNVVFWTNVCCVHVFRVFVSSLKNLPSTILRTTAKYVLYVLTISAFLVGANIVTSYIQSKADLGYGAGMYCYISSPFMVGVTFALPLGVIVVVNFCLFVAVAVHIHGQRTPHVIRNATSSGPSLIIIYAKLSVLTGVTWSFAFLFVLTRIQVFDYLSAIFVAGHGVFIMMSFVTNKRVIVRNKMAKERQIQQVYSISPSDARTSL